MRIRILGVKTFLVFSLVFLSSCGVWDLFSAYFNTYYNARTLYGQAEDEVWAMPEVRDAGKNMLALVPIGSGPKTKFTSVIEKCSKLLQYHPESSLVDDALLMIGRSYFFQGEYQQADRKCRELIDGYPNSALVPDAKVLLAYALYKSRDTVAAEDVARKIFDAAKEDDDSRLMTDAALVLAQLALDAKLTARALEMLEVIGENASDRDMRSNSFLKAAELYAEQKEYVAAERAYMRARDLSRSYLGEFKGLFGAARMIAKQGRYDAAYERLADLRKNLNYRESWGDIDVEIANVYRDQGDITSAVQHYKYVDTAYARAESALNADYELGMLYEMRFQMYDSAKVAYDRARSGPPLAKNMPIVVRKSDYLARYLQYRKEVNRLDSTLFAVLHPPDTTAVKDSVVARPDSLRKDSTALAKVDSLKPKAPAVPPLHPDTVRVRLAGAIDDLAGVLYASMELPDSARYWYSRLVRDFPNSKAAPRAYYVLARIERSDSTVDRAVPDSLYRCIIEKYPDSPFADEARRLLGLPAVVKAVDPAEVSYARGVTLMQNGKTAAAIDTFRVLVKRYPTSPSAVRAMYAAGWLYENETKATDSASAFYERLVTHAPSSVYAQKVQPRVQEVQSARRAALEKVRADSIARATALADSLKAKQAAAAKADSLKHPGVQTTAKPDTSKHTAPQTTAKPDTTIDPGERQRVPPQQPAATPDTLDAAERRRPAQQAVPKPPPKPSKSRENPEEPRVD